MHNGQDTPAGWRLPSTYWTQLKKENNALLLQ